MPYNRLSLRHAKERPSPLAAGCLQERQKIHMKNNKHWYIGAVAAGSLLAAMAVQAAPTDGYVQYNNTYTVQNRTSGCGGFADLGGGEFETWVCAGEER